MSAELHEDGRNEGRHVMREGLHEGAEAEDPRVQRHQLVPRVVVAGLALLPRLLGLLPELLAGLPPGQLDPHLAPEPGQELRHGLVPDKAGVKETPEYLGRLLPHRDVAVSQEISGERDHLGPQLVVGHKVGEVCEHNSLQELEDGELGLVAGAGDAPLQHVEAGGERVGGEDADREVGQGLEAGLGHALVRLRANELAHVGQQLVQDWVHGGRGQSGEINVRDENNYDGDMVTLPDGVTHPE